MELFFYKRAGIHEDSADISAYRPPFKPGEQDDAAICRAENKEEAIIKFSKYFTRIEGNVFSMEELFWIKSDDISLLTPY